MCGHSDCRWIAVTAELATIIDFIRYGASRFSAAGLTFGHSHDNPIDEATHLVLASLHLPPDIPPAYGAGRLTAEERANVLALDERHVERVLDLCAGSGCIGIAMAEYNPDWQVDIVDISDEALSLARENIVF